MSQPTRLASARPIAAPSWIDARLNDAATATARLSEALRRRRRMKFVEQSDGSFAREGARSGAAMLWRDGGFVDAPAWRKSEVELQLAPARCVFRELEFPARAAKFLEGVVRAQIDRVTPWRPSEAAFGWSPPTPLENDRIAIWVAVAKLAPVLELADAAAAAGADAVRITTARIEASAPIAIYVRRAGGLTRLGRWRFAWLVVLFAALAAALAALAAQLTVGAALSDQIEAETAALAQRRTALMRLERVGDDPAVQALDARKRSTPAAIVALEALSRALPDQAYLTEMRLEGEKLDIAGVAANAADLIHAIESSPHFAQATFTAPTTPAADNSGETFQIEARVEARELSPP